MKVRAFGWVFIVPVLVLSCSTPAQRQAGRIDQRSGTSGPGEAGTAEMSGAETADFQEIQKLYSHASYEGAIRKLEVFERKYPESPNLGQIENLHGLSLLLSKNPQLAVEHLKRSVQLTQDNSSSKQFLMYNLAAAQFEAGQMEEAQATSNQIQTSALDADTQVKFHTLRTRLLMKAEQFEPAARELLTLSRKFTAPTQKSLFAPLLEQALQGIKAPGTLDALRKDFSDTPYGDLLLLQLGSFDLKSGQSDSAQQRFKELQSSFPNSPYLNQALDLLRSIQGQGIVDPKTVGVLLPMHGKFAKFGQDALHGIELAFKIFNHAEPDSQISLVVEDSGEDAEQAQRGLDNLFFKHHVIGVIGPLLSKGIESLTLRAEQLGLPLVTLAQQSGKIGGYVFGAGLTPQLQATEVARYAIEHLNIHKFAILSPKGKFGDQYSQAFWDAVESMGGEITGIESYSPGETDFRQVVDKLAGLYYTDARKKEFEALDEVRKTNKILKKTRKNSMYFHLKPVVDFEAVYIPDDPKMAGQILPTFAYEDITHLHYLGISAWNSPELIQRAQSAADGAVFCDAFFPGDPAPIVQKFESRYKETYHQDPTSMEALAYDAGAVIEQVLTVGAKTRVELRDGLKAINRFPGVTGKITYKNGLLVRELPLLTIKNGQVKEAHEQVAH